MAVENRGAETAADQLARLFERFYRADPGRAGHEAHSGLGLAIVAAIARMHGGQAFARSQGGRSRIGLHLPSPARAPTA